MVDPAKRVTLKGTPPAPGFEDATAPQPIDPATGQHGDHWVLPPEERAKGFVRPVRERYRHDHCGTTTRMPTAIAETYARDPLAYGQTFCASCREYLPVSEFTWPDGSRVGS